MMTELYIDGAWVDITTDVRTEDSVSITRGKSDEASQAAPSHCNLTLNNRDGKYSPRNPLSPYFGKIGRNTPIRVRIPGVGPAYDAGSSANGTGNLSWTHTPVGVPKGVVVLITQATSMVDQVVEVTYGGVRMTEVSGSPFVGSAGTENGTVYGFFLGLGIPTGAQTVTVTVNGSSTKHAVAVTVTSDYAVRVFDTNGVTSTLNGGGTGGWGVTLAPGINAFRVGALLSGLDDPANVSPYTDSTQVAGFDFGAEVSSVLYRTVNATTGSPNWTLSATDETHIFAVALIPDLIRFYGEVSSLPPRWAVGGGDAWVPIECAGILRRIGQGSQPLNTGYKTFLLTTNPVTYWPLDDADTALAGAPAKGTYSHYAFERALDTAVMTFGNGDLSPLPNTLRINDTNPAAGADFLSGLCVGSYVTPDALAMDFVYKRNPVATGQKMSSWTVRLYTYGTDSTSPSDGIFDLWGVQFRADGTNNDVQVVLVLDAFGAGTGPTTIVLNDSGPVDAVLDRELHHVRFQLTPSGADVNYEVFVDGVSTVSGTRAAYNLRNSRTVWAFYDRLAVDDMLALGHVIVWETLAHIPELAYTSSLAHGFVGETAGRRFERLCGEAGVPFAGVGDLDDSMPMGAQFTDYFSNQLTEIEATDRGIMFEPRHALALSYRPRRNLYSQAPKATIDYAAGQLSPPFEPVDDDQRTRNDVFAQRREGGSFQATLETGALSVQDPPNGVGRYKDEQQVNVESDGLLPGIASWLLASGTIDAARFPSITVNLAAPDVASDAALVADLLSVDVGDRLVVTNAGAVNLYDDVSVIVLGYSEDIGPVEHTITFNCAPAAPYDTAVYGTAKYDTDGSGLGSGVTSSATSLSVVKTGTSLWTTDAAAFPFDINVAGERMTVTNITSATSPQTFTVTRSVNGVVKAHSSGAGVRLWSTPRYAL